MLPTVDSTLSNFKHTMADPQPIAGGCGANNVAQKQNVNVNPAAQNAEAQLAKQILANTNVMLKQEIIKIPEYFGKKAKDSVTVQEFISRIDECQVSSHWNNTTMFPNFRLCLWGEAEVFFNGPSS